MAKNERKYDRAAGLRRQWLKDEFVAATSFGFGALICAVAAVVSGVWWLWLVASGATLCCIVTGWLVLRKSQRADEK